MASKGIRDQVAIIGMGCTKFGERWDTGVDDLLTDAATEAAVSAGLPIHDIDAFWLGTMTSGVCGRHPVPAAEDRLQAGHPGRELLRHRLRGLSQRLLCGGLGGLRHGHGHRGRETQGHRVLGPDRDPPVGDGTDPGLSSPAAFSFLAPSYGHKYGVDAAQMKEVMSRIAFKNHQNGARNPRAQFQKEVSMETIAKAPLVAGELGVFDCSGVSDGSAAAIICRAEDAHRTATTRCTSRPLSFVAGPAAGPIDPGYDYTTFDEVVRSAADAYAQAGITDPRRQLAMAEVHDCFTPTELVLMEDLGFAERGTAWKEVLAGTFDRDGELPVNPDGGPQELRSPDRRLGPAHALRVLAAAARPGSGRPADHDRRSGPDDGPDPQPGRRPGEGVSFVGVVGTELGLALSGPLMAGASGLDLLAETEDQAALRQLARDVAAARSGAACLPGRRDGRGPGRGAQGAGRCRPAPHHHRRAWGGMGFGDVEASIVLEEIARADVSSAICCQLTFNGPPPGHRAPRARGHEGALAPGGGRRRRPHQHRHHRARCRIGRAEHAGHTGRGRPRSLAAQRLQELLDPRARGPRSAGLVPLARGEGAKGIGAVIVPTDREGVSVTGRHKGMGIHAATEAELAFDGVEIAEEDILVAGDPSSTEAFKILLSHLNHERCGNAAMCVGAAQGALEHAVRYMGERVIGGRPLADLQGLQWKLADMAVQLEGARLLLARAVRLAGDGGTPPPLETALAKTAANLAAKFVCDEAMQIHGGYGYSREYPLERAYRDIRGLCFGAGTVEAQRNFIGLRVSAGGRTGSPGWRNPLDDAG